MLVELTPAQRHAQEVALPKIFDNGFNYERINWYTTLVIEHGGVRGGASVIPEFIAAMIQEAGLNNRALGDQNPDIHFGVGWMQFDTQYYATTHGQIMAIRQDPLFSLGYALSTPDLCYQGGVATHFNKQRWNAWEPASIDPVTGWSPLKAALNAWDKVTG